MLYVIEYGETGLFHRDRNAAPYPATTNMQLASRYENRCDARIGLERARENGNVEIHLRKQAQIVDYLPNWRSVTT